MFPKLSLPFRLRKNKKAKDKGKIGFAGKLVNGLKNVFGQLFSQTAYEPKEYRPYLGPESVIEDPEEKRILEKIRKKQKKRMPESKKPGFFKTLSRDLEIKREIKRKRKHKKRIKKKHQPRKL